MITKDKFTFFFCISHKFDKNLEFDLKKNPLPLMERIKAEAFQFSFYESRKTLLLFLNELSNIFYYVHDYPLHKIDFLIYSTNL